MEQAASQSGGVENFAKSLPGCLFKITNTCRRNDFELKFDPVKQPFIQII